LDNYKKLKKTDGDSKKHNKHSYRPSEAQWQKSKTLKNTLKTTVVKENFNDDSQPYEFEKP
jgi:hypothetical protein